VTAGPVTARAARLAAAEQKLARLNALHDQAMNRFLFEEANALRKQIDAAECARQSLLADLPLETERPPAPYAIAHPKPRWRRRR
jgi:hypothetical protein